jgi:cell division protein FtsQ
VSSQRPEASEPENTAGEPDSIAGERIRYQPPRRLWRAAFFALAMAGIVIGVTWALLGSKLLVVRSVAVTGTHLVPEAEVLAMADVQTGTPMVRVNAAQIAARVDTLRQVQSVQVIKSWPDSIVIKVRERVSAVAVQAPVGGGFDLVDSYGVVVRWVPSRPDRFPVYDTTTAVAALRGNPSVALAAAVLGELPSTVRSSVKSVSVPDGQVTVVLTNGVTVVWGGTDGATTKAQVLAILMRTHAKYYDVSAPGMAMTEG